MKRYTDAQIMRLGVITIVIMLVIMAAAFNLSKFPGFGGTSYTAVFADASGIHRGNLVQVGGIRVGRVQDVSLEDSTVIVKFEVDHGVEFGKESEASIEVLNLLGEKYLELTPAGDGQLAEDTPIPLERTESAYDIVGVFGDLTDDDRADRPRPAGRGPRRRLHDHEPGRARDRGELRRHRPALRDGRVARLRRSRRCSRTPRTSPSCSATAARTSSR